MSDMAVVFSVKLVKRFRSNGEMKILYGWKCDCSVLIWWLTSECKSKVLFIRGHKEISGIMDYIRFRSINFMNNYRSNLYKGPISIKHGELSY